ncbi:hypothetical protein C5E04_15685 [Pectobacterium parmentieri]|uniref:hypothetical protein n=1 Tax=Pectobacterium parmentieri TaxID=1905730 RepID=UPI000EB1448A|nr:hypothetical protein [Pectobacterium parmentieri]RKO80684.1 hypothetical protein C5E04_15685 [Pectobacterium parmentieri]
MIDRELIKNNAKTFLIVVAALSGWTIYNYQQKMQFEDYRNEQLNQIRERELALVKQTSVVDFREQQLATREETLNSQIRQITEREGRLDLREQNVALSVKSLEPELRINKVRDELSALMSKFSDLGVNRAHLPPCNDADMLKRYFQAEAILHEIGSRAQAAKIYEEYRPFISMNTPMLVNMERCESPNIPR